MDWLSGGSGGLVRLPPGCGPGGCSAAGLVQDTRQTIPHQDGEDSGLRIMV